MQLMIEVLRTLAIPLGILFAFSCGFGVASGGDYSDEAPILIDPASYEIDRIMFKEGRPRIGDAIESSLTDVKTGVQTLNLTVAYLLDNPYLYVKINGFSDEMECQGAECDILAARRALLVYDWLKSRGVPLGQLCGYAGSGKTHPVDFSETEKQRQNNRRVEFNASRTICRARTGSQEPQEPGQSQIKDPP